MLSNTKPRLYIEAEDYAYIRAAVMKATPKEVGGLGVIVIEDGMAVVRHMRLLKQTISGGEVEWADDAHPEYLAWLYTPKDDGGAGFEGESYGLYSWHSHGNMGTFWSGTDEDFIRRVGLTVPYIFSTVYNAKAESRNRLDVFTNIGCEMMPEDNRQQVTWGTDAVSLFTIPHPDAEPLAAEIFGHEAKSDGVLAALKAEYETREKEIKKELDDTIKPLKLALSEIHKAMMKDIEAEVKEDFKTYVIQWTQPWVHRGDSGKAHTPPASQSQQKSISAGSTTNSNNGKTNQKHGDTTKKPGKEIGATVTQESGDTGAEDHTDYRHAFIYRCYDPIARITSHFCINQILKEEDLIPLDKIPDEVLARLNDVEAKSIQERPEYMDYIKKAISTDMGYR